MCIICIKKKGVKFPTMKQVENMANNNEHGFSVVVSQRNGKPKIMKTLNKAEFLDTYKYILEHSNYKDTTLFIHARIATHGSKKVENCHGWRSDGVVFAHNGILRIDNREDMTDSETFFRDIFIPAYRVGGWKLGERTIDAIIGTSKFVFMDATGEIHHYGNYIEDDGLLFSNDSYQDPVERWAQYQRFKYSAQPFARTITGSWNEDDLVF